MVSSCALTRTPDGPRKARPAHVTPGWVGAIDAPAGSRRRPATTRASVPSINATAAARAAPTPASRQSKASATRAATGMSVVNVAGPSSRPGETLGDGHEGQLGGSELAAAERCRNRAGRVGYSNARERRPELAAGSSAGIVTTRRAEGPNWRPLSSVGTVTCAACASGAAIAATASAEAKPVTNLRRYLLVVSTVSSLCVLVALQGASATALRRHYVAAMRVLGGPC